MKINILIVEDDEFKASDIQKSIEDTLENIQLARASSVTSALRQITHNDYDLIILDMSLPTFDLSGPGGGGSPQGQGGVEVLRLARRLKVETRFVVVTQYPDIELDGRQLNLRDASSALSSKFGLKIISCLPYQFDASEWRAALKGLVRNIFVTSAEKKNASK